MDVPTSRRQRDALILEADVLTGLERDGLTACGRERQTGDIAVDRDVLVGLQDDRAGDGGQGASGYGEVSGAALAEGDLVTIEFAVISGEDVIDDEIVRVEQQQSGITGDSAGVHRAIERQLLFARYFDETAIT